MAYSRVPFTYTSGPQVFPTNFALGILEVSHIKVYVDGVVDGLGNPVEYAFTYDAATGNVTVTDALTSGQTGVIVRQVPVDTLIADFEAGADVSKRNLVRAVKQTLMAVQEAADGREADSALIQQTVADVNAIADGIADNVAQTTADRIAAQTAAADADADRVAAQAAATSANAAALTANNAAAAATSANSTAQSAKTAAETAANNADADRIAAQAAATAAQADRIATETARTAAETANTQAQAAKTSAEVSAISAENSLVAVAAQVAAVAGFNPENRIINGAFEYWQRGTSFAASGYSTDRWFHFQVGGAASVSRQSFSMGDTLGSSNQRFFARMSVSGQTLASHAAAIQQRIENVRSYAGQTITILGWARRSSGAGNMGVNVAQYFGAGGSPSPDVILNGQAVALTLLWQPFAVTFNVPSVAGKTLATGGNDSFVVAFWASGGADYATRTGGIGLQTIGIDLANVHIRLGTHTASAANLYVPPDLTLEMLQCHRYYVQSVGVEYHMVPAPAASFSSVLRVGYKTLMRLPTPTIAINYTQFFGVSSAQLYVSNRDAFYHQTVASTNTNAEARFTWTSDAEL